MRDPYLIQRCEVKQDWSQAKTVSEALKLDYMGSSEFEWGAIPQFIEQMSKKEDLKVFSHVVNKTEYFILCQKNEIEEYKNILQKLADDQVRTKEFVFNSTTNFWMDLTNKVAFSLNKDVLAKSPSLFKNSVQVILHNREINQEGKDLLQKYDLHKKVKEIIDYTAICPHDIEKSPGTRNLKGKTSQRVVFWLNGPYIGKTWFSGFYTLEEFISFSNRQGRMFKDYEALQSK